MTARRRSVSSSVAWIDRTRTCGRRPILGRGLWRGAFQVNVERVWTRPAARGAGGVDRARGCPIWKGEPALALRAATPYSGPMTPDFALDPRLDADTLAIGDLALSSVRLLDDARFPWLVLVPRRAGLRELTDLDDAEAAALMGEIRLASRVLEGLFGPDKINVGSLGNRVPQLHVHVVARFVSDVAWPGPVWGAGEREPYPAHASGALVGRLADGFAAA